MSDGYFIGLGDKTTCGGKVLDGDERINIFGPLHACAGDRVTCDKDDKTYQIVGGISHMESHGRLMAGTLDSFSNCPCRAQLTPSVFTATYRNKSTTPRATTSLRATTSETAQHAPAATRPTPTNFTSAPISSSGLTETIGSACEQNWRFYQKQAEDFIAPGGKLIADPKARNRAINSAYAQLWRLDNRFQWAGLAAFASKLVGCDLLHAAESIEKIQAEYEATEHLKRSARQGVWGLFSAEERERKAKLQEYEKRQREYEQASRHNPVPNIDWRGDGEPYRACNSFISMCMK